MCEDVYTYLDNIKSSSHAKEHGFVSYFMTKDDTKPKKPKGEGKTKKEEPKLKGDSAIQLKKATKDMTSVYVKPVVKSLTKETMKQYSKQTNDIYKMATKIHELNITDIRHLDRFKADYNYAYLRHEIEKYLGGLSDYDFDTLHRELMDIDQKYKNQTEIIRIALESLKRFLEHKNFMYYNEEEDNK